MNDVKVTGHKSDALGSPYFLKIWQFSIGDVHPKCPPQAKPASPDLVRSNVYFTSNDCAQLCAQKATAIPELDFSCRSKVTNMRHGPPKPWFAADRRSGSCLPQRDRCLLEVRQRHSSVRGSNCSKVHCLLSS